MAAKAPARVSWRPLISPTPRSVHAPYHRASPRFSYVSLAKANGRPCPNQRLRTGSKQLQRNASTSETAGDVRSVFTRTKNLLLGSAIVLVLGGGYFYVTDTRAALHEWLVVPLLRYTHPDGEDAHIFGNKALKMLHSFGIHLRERGDPDMDGILETKVFDHILANPIALSAGIDKHADIPDPLFALGPSIIELGGATPYPQEGNAKPRVFRVTSQNALINRYGLNSEGADFIAMRLRQRVREFAYRHGYGMDAAGERAILDGAAGVPPGSLTKNKLLAVQIAKNSFTPDNDIEAVKRDYVYCTNMLAKYADIITVNVSSPNTPGLRGLQKTAPLTEILTSVVAAVQKTERATKPAIMVKVSPDEDSDQELQGICDAVWKAGVDGVIVGNTTKRRPPPMDPQKPLTSAESVAMAEQGGFSGPHLFERTVALVHRYRHFLDDGHSFQPDEAHKVIFATGGITNGHEAMQILGAGANVAMVYTAMVYGGAGTISKIKQQMRDDIHNRPKSWATARLRK